MDVLELPRPVINFLRTMSKEMHRYSLCWDIYGGSESVTLTLTWKLNSAAVAGAALPPSVMASTETGTTTTGDSTDAEESATVTTSVAATAAATTTANHSDNHGGDAYTKKSMNDMHEFNSDTGAAPISSGSGK